MVAGEAEIVMDAHFEFSINMLYEVTFYFKGSKLYLSIVTPPENEAVIVMEIDTL